MEIIPEGKNFRLVNDDELPRILETLEKYLPHSIKVRCTDNKKKSCIIGHFKFHASLSPYIGSNQITLK